MSSIQEAARREIRLAMARRGLEGFKELAPILGQKEELVGRKLAGSRDWTLRDVGKVCESTAHEFKLVSEHEASAVELLQELRRSAHENIQALVEADADPLKKTEPEPAEDPGKPGVSSWP